MQDNNFILRYLEKYYDEVTTKEFYRGIFPAGELAAHNEIEQQGKYNAIAVELLPKADENKSNVRRYILTDELDYLDELEKKNNFIIISPISYVGRSRKAENARFIYAMAIDLDGMTKEQNIIDLFYQMENDILPTPTYTVASGSGLHLYYCFEKPIPAFKNITKQLQALKQDLTKKIWNSYVTSLYDKPQLQSLFQGFRMCGGVTKSGDRTKAFLTGKVVSIEQLNYYCLDDRNQVKEFTYKSDLTLKEAAEKYPQWFEKRIINKQPKGSWTCKKDLYNWWLRRIKEEIVAGHRYYAIMCLAIYAKKCGVDREELEADAFSLLEIMEQLTTEDNNHFKREDILAALELYNDSYITFPIDTITQLTALPIEKNKRNGRKQQLHLEIARNTLQTLNKYSDKTLQGRPKGSGTKEEYIKKWRQLHPAGTKAECIKETGISKPTVYKYWESE